MKTTSICTPTWRDLEEIQSRLSRQILKTKLEQNPLFVSEEDLGLEVEDEPFTVSDLEEKYEQQASEKLDKWVGGYFTGHDEQGQFLVMVLKPLRIVDRRVLLAGPV